MDYTAAAQRIYDHLENDDVYKATMACLRIARNIKDYFNAATFLREFYPEENVFIRTLLDDTSHLKQDTQKFIFDTSLEHWLEIHTLDFNLFVDEYGKGKNVLAIGVGEIKSELEQWECSINDLRIPQGMGEFDTAAFTDKYNNEKAKMRLRIQAIHKVKERIKIKCLNYAINIEKQLQSQQKSESFLHECYIEVNNYFKSYSEDVYIKLQKASQLIDSNDSEDFSLLLTQVRRAIKAAADYFYPPNSSPVICSNGEERNLGEEQYLNRLQEYLNTFKKSSSRDLLRAELELLSVFARRLSKVASKGVHSNVKIQDAKQGLIGLYMLLYNIIIQIQTKDN